MRAEEFNYASFMGVLNATQQDDRGVFIPGELMPSGKPVRAEGVKKAQLMSGDSARQMAETWVNAVRSTYEREAEEKNHQVSTADVPELVIGGADRAPAERGPSVPPAGVPDQTIEAQLQASAAVWRARVERLEFERETVSNDLRAASAQLAKIEAALLAVMTSES